MSNPDRSNGISIGSSPGRDHSQVRQRKSPASGVDVESLKPKSEIKELHLRWWNKIVVVSCVIAVLTDPLFLYIPLINDKSKCLGMDKSLRIAALLLRSLTDIIFIIDIIHQVRDRNKILANKVSNASSSSSSHNSSPEKEKKDAVDVTRRLRRLSVSIIIHLLAILPFPQVSILVAFLRMRDAGYLSKGKILNACLLFQYVPNIYRLRISCKKLDIKQRMVKGAFNFFLYIVACHVIGAFWYFFSIQRETSCWLQACKNIEGCIATRCDDNTSTNVAFLVESCPINPSNATLFDFGMYLDTIQSGYTRQRSFPKKFFYSFWWGLKNLSNFGTNLDTSSYVWENCFAILISVTGLLLFLYLIGNVQAYIQFSKSIEMNEDELSKQMKEKENEILNYLMPRNGLPQEMREEIMTNIKYDKLKNKLNSDIDMDLLFYLLPWNIGISIKHHVGMSALKKVPTLKHMDDKVLERICDHLKPVSYIDGHVFKTGEAIDSVLFITEGTILPIHDVEDNSISQEKLDYFGEQLLMWVSPRISFADLQFPMRTQKFKCHTKVEAFALMAKDLISIVNDFRCLWNWSLYNCDIDSHEFEESASSLNKTNETYIKLWEEKLASVQKKKIRKEILEWVSRTGLLDDVNKKIKKFIKENKIAKEKIGAAVDLRFLFSILPQDIKNMIGINALRKVPALNKMPGSMLESICRYLEPKIYNENSHIVQAGTELDSMLFVIEGVVICTNMTSDVATTGSYMMPKLLLEKGDTYGEKLLSWASSSSVPDLPISTQYFKCQTKVEAFSLKASQLHNVVSKLGLQWSVNYIAPPDHENKTYVQKLKEVYMQLTTTSWEKIEDEEFIQKMKIMKKEKDILEWLSRYDLPDDVTTETMRHIIENKGVEKDIDCLGVDVNYLLSMDLPWSIEKSIRHHLYMKELENVPMLKKMSGPIMESVCRYFEPVVYSDNDYVVERGKPLDFMLIIIEGEMILVDTMTSDAGTRDSSTITKHLGKGDIFGEELLNWASPEILFAGSAPTSPHHVQCQTKVEAFALTTSKLRTVVSEYETEWKSALNDCNSSQELEHLNVLHNKIDQLETRRPEEIDDEELRQQVKIKNKEKDILEWVSRNGFDEELKKKIMFHIKINNSVSNNLDDDVDLKYLLSLSFPWSDIAGPITEHLCMSTLKKVPTLQNMPEDVLKRMCFHVEAVVYSESEFVVQKGQSLDFMLIIVEGVIEWTARTISAAGTADSTIITKEKGNYFGERLLKWASPKNKLSGSAHTSRRDVICRTKVEAFRLTLTNLRTVVSEYDLEWNSNFNDCNDPDHLLNEFKLSNAKWKKRR